MNRLWGLCAVLVAAPGVAQTDLAAAFGAREGVLSASLSPDGQKIALIASAGGQATRLFIVDTVAGAVPKPILLASGKPENLYSCKWAATDRLVCTVGGLTQFEGDIIGFSNLVSVDVDGKNIRMLSNRRGADALNIDTRGGTVVDYLPDENGIVLMMRSYVPEARIGTIIEKTEEGMGVDRIDTRTGASKKVEGAQRDAVEYITDGHGGVRIKGVSPRTADGYDKGAVKYLYRQQGSRDWLTLSTYVYADRSGFNPYAVDRDTNLAYGFEKIDGRLAAVSYTLDNSRTRTVLYQHPSVDVDGLVRVGRRGRVIGVTYATDKRAAVYFDPVMKAVTASLSKALGGRTVYVTDTSTDENRLLLWAGSDTDAGQFYLFDRAARKLSPVIPQRPQLTDLALANVQPITYPAADGTMVPAYLTLPPGKDAKGLARDCPASRWTGRARRMGLRLAVAIFRGAWFCRHSTELSRIGWLWRCVVQGKRVSVVGNRRWRCRLGREISGGKGDCRSREADHFGLVLWRLCGVASRRRRAEPVQSSRGDCARDRSRHAVAGQKILLELLFVEGFYRVRPAHRGGVTRAQCRPHHGTGADVSGHPRRQRPGS